jgi:phage baseplate assembly protein W
MQGKINLREYERDMSTENIIYGTGPAFPFKRDGIGNFRVATGQELVEMGIKQAILTEIGKRPMFKNLGNQVNRVLFTLEGTARDNVIKEYVIKAVRNMEPRVVIDETIVKDGKDKSEIFIEVYYRLIKTNVEGNMVLIELDLGGL